MEKAGASLRLFCFPWAGGSAAAYAGWEAAFGESVELCAIELHAPGSCPPSTREIAERLLAELPSHAFDELPYAVRPRHAARRVERGSSPPPCRRRWLQRGFPGSRPGKGPAFDAPASS